MRGTEKKRGSEFGGAREEMERAGGEGVVFGVYIPHFADPMFHFLAFLDWFGCSAHFAHERSLLVLECTKGTCP